MNRKERQAQVGQWMVDTFGEVALDTEERALRLFEEVVELAQVCGVDPERLIRLLRHVYAKEAGDVTLEVAQVGVCLLAFGDATGIDVDLAEAAEIDRITSLPAAHHRRRHNAKAEQGLGGHVEEPSWQPMATAPRDARWILARTAKGIYRVHYAEDLSGSEPPAYRGWFQRYGQLGYRAVEGLVEWRPDPNQEDVE